MILNKPSEQELRNMLKKGKTLYQISRHFNTTIKEVHKLEIEYGITRKQKIPRPNKQDLESMYNKEGMTQYQIGKEFGVTPQYVGTWIRNHNISTVGRRGVKVLNISKEVLQRMYIDEGMTQYQISREFGVAESTVQGRICDYKIPTRGSTGTIETIPSKEVLQQMYTDEGMTQWQIGKEFGVYQGNVSIWLCKRNIPTRGSNGTLAVPMPPKEVLERMYIVEGMTQWQIGKEFGVYQSTVSIWLIYYKIPTRCGGLLAFPIPPKDDLLNYIGEGLNQHQIAEKYEVSDWKIYDWCEYYDIPGMVNNFRCTTPEHREWRDAVFDRDHYTCQKCGAIHTPMQAHHIVPYCDHPEVAYELENGITLCKNCHEFIRCYEYEYIEQFAAITQPHLRDHEVIESMPWEAPLPPLSDKLFHDYPQQEVIL